MPFVGYYDGEFVESDVRAVPIEERGHQFGDGVYEVVRVYGGRPFLLDWHLERLENSLKTIAIENPFDRDGWTQLIGEAIRRSGEAEATVYWQVTRGIAPRNHLFPSAKSVVSLTVRPLAVSASPAKEAPSAALAHAALERADLEPATGEPGPVQTADTQQTSFPPLIALPDERWVNAFVKSINLLPNVIAKEIAHRYHAQEAMLVRNGWITECSGSNVWFVRGGELWTAPTNRYILPGITRRFVLELAQEAGIPVHEEALHLDALQDVEEVFVTSTTQEIQLISSIVTPLDKETALYNLPADLPPSLVDIGETFKTLWTSPAAPVVGLKLGRLFSETVQRIQQGETPLAVSK